MSQLWRDTAVLQSFIVTLGAVVALCVNGSLLQEEASLMALKIM